MIHVMFLEHSGFLAELDTAVFLFDWWKGELPALPDKPLFCCVSHRHPDHFDPRIFALDDGRREIHFLLGKGIRLSPQNREKWGLSDTTAEKCAVMRSNQEQLFPGVRIRSLPSTDEGVSFLVESDGKTLFHAGDLNWWHWDEEGTAWNRNMEVNFKRYAEILRGMRLDAAFAPLDPRLGEACGWGFAYLAELADIRALFPMHQWDEFGVTDRFCAEHPELAGKVVRIFRPGQSWELT